MARRADQYQYTTSKGTQMARPRKYTPKQRLEVQTLREEGLSIRKIAVAVGMSKTNVDRILKE